MIEMSQRKKTGVTQYLGSESGLFLLTTDVMVECFNSSCFFVVHWHWRKLACTRWLHRARKSVRAMVATVGCRRNGWRCVKNVYRSAWSTESFIAGKLLVCCPVRSSKAWCAYLCDAPDKFTRTFQFCSTFFYTQLQS